MTFFAQTADADQMTLVDLLSLHWPIVVTAVLGAIGIYGLLPQARRSRAIWGGLLAALAVLAAALWMLRYEGVWPERLLFYSFSLLAILGAVMLLGQSNPVHAALSFALVVLSTCGLFLLLAAPFLMAATMIIYAGAIVVTFLFVIMLAQQAGQASADARSREPFLASLAGFVLLGSLWIVLDRTYDVEPLVRELEHVAAAQRIEDVEDIWGTRVPGEDQTLAVVDDLRNRFPEEMVLNLEAAWARRDLVDLKRHASSLVKHAEETRHLRGRLTTPDRAAAPPPALPARNVAAIGRTLFTDHLIVVEMAGVLLLVATIGAILIASRRSETLR